MSLPFLEPNTTGGPLLEPNTTGRIGRRTRPVPSYNSLPLPARSQCRCVALIPLPAPLRSVWVIPAVVDQSREDASFGLYGAQPTEVEMASPRPGGEGDVREGRGRGLAGELLAPG